jgi:heterodisulfide reductase subunit A
MIPNPGTEELASMLKCPVGQDGFFLEAHLKLRPLDFTNDGLFLAGTAAGPKDLTDTLITAAGAAARACRILSQDELEVEATTTVILESLCIGCGRCEKVCSYGAITLSGKPNDLKSSVNPALCKSCGSCAAECPTGAARARHFTTDQIVDMIDSWGGV